MGATKRVGELLMISLDERSAARTQLAIGAGRREVDPARPLFTAVRFGNVLGSRGSVVPTFVQQIDQGGPVTVTHPEMTRYFISVAEAVSLVIQAATLTRGGDLYMLDMGQAIQIKDLAHKLIRLRGLRPDLDIPVVYSGVRPGEKLHEELIAPDETRETTAHPKVFRIRTALHQSSEALLDQIGRLTDLALEQHREPLLRELQRLVRGQSPARPAELRPSAAERPQEVAS
jgi:FlaA1/EpsC-like NDP-sugar epimerase